MKTILILIFINVGIKAFNFSDFFNSFKFKSKVYNVDLIVKGNYISSKGFALKNNTFLKSVICNSNFRSCSFYIKNTWYVNKNLSTINFVKIPLIKNRGIVLGILSSNHKLRPVGFVNLRFNIKVTGDNDRSFDLVKIKKNTVFNNIKCSSSEKKSCSLSYGGFDYTDTNLSNVVFKN